MNFYYKIEQIDHFTHSEQILIDFILQHLNIVLECNVQELAKKLNFNVNSVSYYQ